ncbi:MAG: DUF1566 domain-containing protein [Nitrospinota bacterium]|nr:DUF1566 domain-containing protein [Nitrospinota bacterium]
MAEEETKPVVQDTQTDKLEIVDEGPKRFVEHGPQVIQDTKTGLYWLKKDSWQDRGKYFNWHEAKEFAERKNVRKIGGFADWRLPTNEEAATLYNEEWENKGKSGETIHIDPLFPEGSFKMQWTMADTSTRRPRFDYISGQIASADEYAFGSVRICRKDPVRTVGRRRNT